MQQRFKGASAFLLKVNVRGYLKIKVRHTSSLQCVVEPEHVYLTGLIRCCGVQVFLTVDMMEHVIYLPVQSSLLIHCWSLFYYFSLNGKNNKTGRLFFP